MVDTLPEKKHAIFYGNSSRQIGAGHIMRLLALAQHIKEDGFKVTFLYKKCLVNLIERLNHEGFNTIQLNSEINERDISALYPHILVIDDYNLSNIELQSISALQVFTVLFDDALNQDSLFADLIINSSPNATISSYKHRAPQANLCLGPKYTILRKEFSQIIAKNNINYSDRQRLIMTLGGTDVKNLSYPLCKELIKHLPDIAIDLILGVNAPEKIIELNKENDKLQVHINSTKISSIMSQAKLAISAAGGTMGELAAMQVPTIALVCADNQLPALTSKLNGSWYTAIDARRHPTPTAEIISTVKNLWENQSLRVNMHRQARKIVDTNGCDRIIKNIKEFTC